MNDRENHLVELVSPDGKTIGSTTVESAHLPPGELHRAFSVFLVDPAGRILLQRRAATKTRFAGRWANACCGHPAPGSRPTDSAGVRLREELGVEPVALRSVGVYVYRAADVTTGRVEHEYDHVLLGAVPADIAFDLDPTEVSEVRWARRDDLADELAAAPDNFAPWFAGTFGLMPPS